MKIHELIAKANEAYASSNTSLAMEFLKEAGEIGDVNAALDYAYFLYRLNPIEAVQYLESVSCAENAIVQYHALLIAYFSDLITESFNVASRLISLAEKGVVEANLVILSYLPKNSDEFSSIAGKIRKLAPNIYKQLKLDDYVNDKGLTTDINKITACLHNALNDATQLRCRLDDNLPVEVFENTLWAFECNYLIVKYSALLQPSMVVDPITGEGRTDNVRTSYVAVISPEHCDWLTRKVDRLIATATNTRRCEGEALNLLRYTPGQEYKPHYDALNKLQDVALFNDGGQRRKTAIIYLNSVNDGGQTTFPKLGLRVSPVMGNMLVFTNSDDKGNILTNSYHAGESTKQENKWLITKWVREHTTNYGKFLYGNH